MCALPDLQAEARRVAGVSLVLAQPQTLLVYASKYLNAPISDATLLQASNSAQPPPHTVRELSVSRIVLDEMIRLTDAERDQLTTRLATLTAHRTTALQQTSGTALPPFSDTTHDMERLRDETADRLRRSERILRLLRRTNRTDDATHLLIRWHGYPAQAHLEQLAEHTEQNLRVRPARPDANGGLAMCP